MVVRRCDDPLRGVARVGRFGGALVTVGAAYRVPGLGCALACDGRLASDEGHIYTDHDRKWGGAGSITFLVAGSTGALLPELFEVPPRSWRELRPKIFNRDAKYTGVDYEFLVYDRTRDRLVQMDHTGDEIRCGVFSVIGCGSHVAFGALDVSETPKTLEQAAKLVRRAVVSACKRNSACGGRVTVLTVPRRGKSVVT